MGRRAYVPTIGQFLQSDPVPGGGASAYGYTNGDPVNDFDLSGTISAGPAELKYTQQCQKEAAAGHPCGTGPSLLSRAASFVAAHAGQFAEFAVGGACLFAAEEAAPLCLRLTVGAFAGATAQNLTSAHPSPALVFLDALGTIPGVEALGLTAKGVLGAGIGATAVKTLGGATGLGATALDFFLDVSNGGSVGSR